MEEELISFKTAKLAKEKGFNWECRYLFKSELGWEEGVGVDYNWNYFNSYSAPTQSLLQKWLREIHKLDIQIESVWEDRTHIKIQYCPWVMYTKEETEMEDDAPSYFDTYEDALEDALIESLNLIK